MSVINEFKRNSKFQFLFIQISFILISILFVSCMFYSNRIASSNDSIFNYQRIIDVFKQLLHLKWPQFEMYTSLPMGSATATFYPWLIFLPFAPLILVIHNPMMFWCTIISIGMFVGLNVAYYSCISLEKSKRIAYLFSLFYSFSTIQILCAISSSDIGEYMAILMAPLTFFGWLHWLKSSKWEMMSIGFILISFCHILAFIIAVISIILMTILFITKIKWNKNKILSLAISVITTIFGSSVIWLPIYELVKYNPIVMPETDLKLWNTMAPVIPNNLTFLVWPWQYKVWTFSDLVAIILIIIYWKKLDCVCKRLSIFAFFYILLNMGPIKDFLIFHTFLINIQFMYRICFISHLLLSFVLSVIIVQILLKKWYIQNICSLILLLLALMIGSIYLSSASLNMLPRKSLISFNEINNIKTITFKQNAKKQHNLGHTILSNKIMRNKKFLHYNSNLDYLPDTPVHKWLTNTGYIYHHHTMIPVTYRKYGTIGFYNKKFQKSILLPIVVYSNQRYKVKINNRSSKTIYNHQYKCLEIHDCKKGFNQIKIEPKIMNYRYISIILLLISISMLILTKKR